ncbi:MAG TPA: tRNA pseudouridine(13) synthase TruD, partial [Persephonella sp.]|nr:tRNA pseudouridine(13) synthase TruD [Persephonella sp.]
FPRFFPILGYKVKLSDKEADIYRYVLEKEGFTFEDMLCRLKQLKIKGDYRKTFLKAENIHIKNGRINFFLPKGAYATMFLKNVFIQ